MKTSLKMALLTAAAVVYSTGCQSQTSPKAADPSASQAATQAEADDHDHTHEGNDHEDANEIAAAVEKLSPEDRKDAESQKFCAVMTTTRLGSMGAPLKLDVNGQPVFVCCAGCKGKATKNADETLATVARLKAENGGSKE